MDLSGSNGEINHADRQKGVLPGLGLDSYHLAPFGQKQHTYCSEMPLLLAMNTCFETEHMAVIFN